MTPATTITFSEGPFSMSYDIGMNTIKLQPQARLGHTEYCSNWALIKEVTGIDPKVDMAGAIRAFNEAWQMDFTWYVNDGPKIWPELGRATDMGHAEFLEGGVDKRETVTCPFNDIEEVFNFDAMKEYELLPMDELVAFYEGIYQDGRKENPGQVFTGGYYKTIVSGAIEAFGWDMLLMAASEPERFDRVLETIFQRTLYHVQAWAKTSMEVFLQHDDMVWTAGAFIHPDFYRASIFPRYKKLWDVIHDAGKPVLFCSDGNFTEFVDDIAAAGADGFIFEPMTDLDLVVDHYGKTHSIIASKLDCRTLTFGTKDQIKQEIDETLKIAKDCPGFFFAVGNHIPSNVPLDNALFYFDYLSKNWER